MSTPTISRGWRSIVVCMALVAAASAATAGVNHWTTSGPYGGRVGPLVADPRTPGTVYAGFPGVGIFKTVDGGASWSDASSGLPDDSGRYFDALAIDPVTTATVYAGLLEGGVWKSPDGGATWSHLGLDTATGLAVDPRNPSILYVATAFGFSKSLDAGATWQDGSGLPEVVTGLFMDPAHPDVLYTVARGAAYPTAPLFRSVDAGATWQRVPTPFERSGIEGVAVDPSSSRVFAASSAGIFRSGDHGDHWQHVLSGGFQSVSVAAPSEVYAVSPDSTLYQSRNGGDSWAVRPIPVPIYGATFAASAADPASVFGGSVTSGVIKSGDGGVTWAIANSGQLGLSTFVVGNSRDAAHLFAGTGDLFRSDDGGGAWNAIGEDAFVFKLALDPESGILYSRLGRSTDGGVTWTAIPYPDASIDAPTIGVGSHTLWVGTCSDSTARIFSSRNRGDRWTLAFDSHATGCVSSLVVSPSGSDIYATVGGSGSEIIQSRDGGFTWRAIDATGWPGDWRSSVLGVLAIDPTNPDALYAFVSSRLWVSTTGGGQWHSIVSGLPGAGLFTSALPTAMVVDPAAPSTLYLATSPGVYRSVDGGENWHVFGGGLPQTPISSLVIDATGTHLHAGLVGGVFDYEVSGACHEDASTLCLLEARFHVTAAATDPKNAAVVPARAMPQADHWGAFSLPDLTGDATIPEITIKMVDGTAINGAYWVVYAGLTTLPYAITVTDGVTGKQSVYRNDYPDPLLLCGGGDGSTFTAGGTSSEASSGPATSTRKDGAESTLSLFDRFRVSILAYDPRNGGLTTGLPVPRDGRWGYFAFPELTGSAATPEAFVKMIDATGLPDGGYWFFFSGLTGDQYTLTVTDTVTGAQKQYENPRFDPAPPCGGVDTTSFHR